MAAVRSGILFGFVALVAFVLLTLLQLYGLNLLAVLLIGVLAGVFATSGMRRGSGVGRGLTTGLIGGLIMLLGSLFVGILLISFFRSQINVWLAGLPFIDAVPVVGDTVSDTIGEVNERAEPWLRGGGLALGGCLGIVNLLLMTFGGALGGAVRRR